MRVVFTALALSRAMPPNALPVQIAVAFGDVSIVATFDCAELRPSRVSPTMLPLSFPVDSTVTSAVVDAFTPID